VKVGRIHRAANSASASSLANSSSEAPTHHRPCLITPLPNFENHYSLQNSSQSSNQIGKIRLSESCFTQLNLVASGRVVEGISGLGGVSDHFGDIEYIVPAKNGHPKKRHLASMRLKMCQKIRHRASHRNWQESLKFGV
jgi:hypothetical protein